MFTDDELDRHARTLAELLEALAALPPVGSPDRLPASAGALRLFERLLPVLDAAHPRAFGWRLDHAAELRTLAATIDGLIAIGQLPPTA